jgi:hypothetical protein
VLSGVAEEVALGVLHADLEQGVEFLGLFHAFGDECGSDLVGEGAHSGGQRLPNRVGMDVGRDRSVELDELRTQAEDVTEARIAGSGIVNGDANSDLSQLSELMVERVVVVHDGVLGDLEDETFCGDCLVKQKGE